MRQTQGSMVCPACGKLISVHETRCPFCEAWRPGLYGWTPLLQRLFGRHLDLISLITTSCIVLYTVALLLQPEAITNPSGLMSILSPGSRALYQLGMTGGVAWSAGWWWTVLTAIYLHGSLLHIVFNVMWIRNLGPTVTDLYGPARAFILFEVGGVSGFLLSNFVTGNPTIGASGSIFGLLAALIVYGRRRGASMMTAQFAQWAVVLFVMGFIFPGVNNWAHLGGFVGGWGAAHLMIPNDVGQEGSSLHLLALVFLAMTLIGVLLSFTRVTSILLAT